MDAYRLVYYLNLFGHHGLRLNQQQERPEC